MKQPLAPLDMIKIANQHALSADFLLNKNAEIAINEQLTEDVLLPITSLIYVAFELTLKACLIHQQRRIVQPKSLIELVELNDNVGFAKEELTLIKTLSRHQAFRKGMDYLLWDSREQLHVFCKKLMQLYKRLHECLPIELDPSYQ